MTENPPRGGRRRLHRRPPWRTYDALVDAAPPTSSCCASSYLQSVGHHGFWVRSAAAVVSLLLPTSCSGRRPVCASCVPCWWRDRGRILCLVQWCSVGCASSLDAFSAVVSRARWARQIVSAWTGVTLAAAESADLCVAPLYVVVSCGLWWTWCGLFLTLVLSPLSVIVSFLSFFLLPVSQEARGYPRRP